MNTSAQPFVILLAEDEEADAGLVRWALEVNEIRADLHHVSDGHEALAFMRRKEPEYQNAPIPDLILLDLNMPRMGGLECLATLKKDAALSNIPVVVLSTSHAEGDVFASHDLGAADYFSKPMDIYHFAEAVRLMAERWMTPGVTKREKSPAPLLRSVALLQSLPALPQIAIEILALKLSTDTGNALLLKLVNKDPAILAKIIGLANSPLFGPSRPITTLNAAATVLGMNRIKMVALSFAMVSSMKRNSGGLLDANQLWQHSMAVALAMDELSMAMPARMRPSEDDVYLTGLLHDIGFLVLDHVDPKLSDDFHAARLNAKNGRSIAELEAEMLEMGHCELGALLAGHWNLSESLVAVLRNHHSDGVPESAVGQPLIAMTRLTEKLLPIFDTSGQNRSAVDAAEWMELRIGRDRIDEVEASMRKRAQEVKSVV